MDRTEKPLNLLDLTIQDIRERREAQYLVLNRWRVNQMREKNKVIQMWGEPSR